MQCHNHPGDRLNLGLWPVAADPLALNTDRPGVTIATAIILGGAGVPGPDIEGEQLPDDAGLGDPKMGRDARTFRRQPLESPGAIVAGIVDNDQLRLNLAAV